VRRTAIWPIIVCLLITAFLLGACKETPATSTAPATTVVPTTAKPTTVAPTTAVASDKPRYGGTITAMLPVDVTTFDPGVGGGQLNGSATAWVVNEQWTMQDWAQGLAGSAKVDWVGVAQGPANFVGMLAESYSIPTLGTTIFKVRRGVRYALDPNSEASRLVGGREMTAQDWIDNFNYMMNNPKSSIKVSQPVVARTATLEKTGEWEVTLKTPEDPLTAFHWLTYGGGFYFQFPPEVAKKYGSNADWRNVVGTGPFMISDFVPGSSVTLLKNPKYWMTDPVGPGKGNQLPYADSVKMLIVPDLSTRYAAVRTGKADYVTGVEPEDAKSLLQTTPQLKSVKYLPGTPYVVGMRTDKQDLPFKDKRVRQALMMATDFESIKKDLYAGDAEIQIWPISKEFTDAFVSVSQMPQTVQDLYKYSPDKAKALLKDAGYPNGFKTAMIIPAAGSDRAETLKAMWAKVGVDVEIQLRETAVYNSMAAGRTHEQMLLRTIFAIYPSYLNFTAHRGASFNNPSYVNDPPGSDKTIEDAYQAVQKNVLVNMPGVWDPYRKMLPYLLEQAPVIPWPSPRNTALWWPWLKNYHGEAGLNWLQFYWVDQDVKRQLGK
jgi:peptide/nickel transport system substrate-binding protein